MRMTVELANGTKVAETYPSSWNPVQIGYQFRTFVLAAARSALTTVKWNTLKAKPDAA